MIKIFDLYKKVNLFLLFAHFPLNSISYRLKLIDFDIFNIIQAHLNQFRRKE